jgi:hypothetical protein
MFDFSWQSAYDDCKAFVARVKAAGGVAEVLYPPDLNIRGNSHMIMQDENNLQIADLILKWIDRHTRAGQLTTELAGQSRVHRCSGPRRQG